jgi:hypothetical protein
MVYRFNLDLAAGTDQLNDRCLEILLDEFKFQNKENVLMDSSFKKDKFL